MLTFYFEYRAGAGIMDVLLVILQVIAFLCAYP